MISPVHDFSRNVYLNFLQVASFKHATHEFMQYQESQCYNMRNQISASNLKNIIIIKNLNRKFPMSTK